MLRVLPWLMLLLLAGPGQASETSAAALAARHPDRPRGSLSPRIGNKLEQALAAYQQDEIARAIALLDGVDGGSAFEQAQIDRFLGNLYAIEAQHAKASQHLAAALASDQLSAVDHAQALRLQADLALQQQQYAQAIGLYQQWLDFTGGELADIYLRQAQAHYQLKQYAQMITPLQRAIALSPQPDKNAYLLLLASYYERQLYPQALKVLEQLVAHFPDDKRWWSQLGMLYLHTGDQRKALATLEGAYLAGLLTHGRERRTLAQLYAANGIPHKAARLQQQALDEGLLVADDSNLAALAGYWLAAKELAQALPLYQRLAAGGNGDYARQAGQIQLQLRQPDAAIASFEQALAAGAKPRGAIYLELARAHLQLEQLAEAYGYVQKALAEPQSAAVAGSWARYLKARARQQGVML